MSLCNEIKCFAKSKTDMLQYINWAENKKIQLKLWTKAIRAPFFQAVVIPVMLGTAIAWHNTGIFHLAHFLLALIGALFVHAGTNLANDYFDYKGGTDNINTEFTPFNGGSRVIQDSLISPKRICYAFVLFFGLGILIGLYFIWACGWPILVFGGVGLLSGYFYTASPIRIGYRGWGELLVGLNFGPLVVLGAYYIQAETISLEALLASVPIGFLMAAVLYINEFPDYYADKSTNKNTLVVILGRQKAIKGYYFLLVSAYLIIFLGVVAKMMPWLCLSSLFMVPLVWKSMRIATINYTSTEGLKPVMANTIAIHLTVGLLLSISYFVTRIFV